MRYVTSEEMRGIDRMAIEDYGIPGIVLMENAVLKIMKHIPVDKDRYAIVAGSGNNGGDGIGVARQLYISGKSVDIILFGDSKKLKGDAKINFEIVKKLYEKKDPSNTEINIIEINSEIEDGLNMVEDIIKNSDIVIDAIFGTGLSSEVRGTHRSIIQLVNEHSSYTVSVDIPSGLNGDNGEVMGVAIRADKTVTLQYPKVGFKNRLAEAYLGELIIENISIPKWI